MQRTIYGFTPALLAKMILGTIVFAALLFCGVSSYSEPPERSSPSQPAKDKDDAEPNHGKLANRKIILDEVTDTPDPFRITEHQAVTMTGKFRVRYSDVLGSQGAGGEKYEFFIRHTWTISSTATGAIIRQMTGETAITPPDKPTGDKESNYFKVSIQQLWNGLDQASQPVIEGVYGYSLYGELIRKRIEHDKCGYKPGKEKDKADENDKSWKERHSRCIKEVKLVGVSNILYGTITVITGGQDTTPPPIPALVSPLNGAIIGTGQPTFTWQEVFDPSAPVTYILEIASDTGFTQNVISKTDIATTTYQLSPETLAEGAWYWRVRARDGVGNTSEPSVAWSFTFSVDHPPVLTSPGNQSIDENQLLSFTLIATDPDNDAITYSMAPVPAGATLNATTGAFSWQPDYTQAGSYEITFKATANALFDTKTITITVNNVDRPPVLVSPGNKTVNENQLLTFTLSATDPDGDAITYSMTPALAGATLSPTTGVFNWTPDFTQSGTYNVTFKATANTLFDTKVITITVNNVDRVPVLVSPGNQTVNENQALTFTLSATDPDGDAITYSMEPALTGATLDATTGVFAWTPDYTQAGTYNVTFKATANGLSDTKVVTITVNNVDRAPVLVSPGNKTVNEGQVLAFTLSATDADGDVITYSMNPAPTGASLDASTGEFSWQPDYTQAGSYTVTFTATANLLTDAKTITITVNNVDRAPVLTSPGNKTVNENQLLTFTLSATDPDGDVITYSMEPAIAGVSLDATTGIFNWTPTYDQAGSYEVTFKATANSLSDTKTITITVNNVDRALALASPGNQTVDENQLLTFTLSATDPDGDAITYSGTGLPTGSSIDANTGVFTWTPDYTQAGTYNVTFKATANDLFDTKTITITVNNVDRAPVLTSPGNKTVNESQLLAFTLSGSDPDGDAITYSMEPVLTGATLDATTGAFSWTPDYTQSGTYEVTFNAAANGLFDTKIIIITVDNVDRAPVLASPGNKTVNEAQLLTFTLSATDPDGDAITYSATNLPDGANLDATTGVFSWTPDYTQAGSYEVTFQATSNILSDTKTITIIVNNVDRAPVLTSPGNKTVNEGELLTFTLSATDPDGDAIVYSMEPIPAGVALDSATGVFNWIPGYDQTGNYAITFTATANSLSDSKAIIITVGNVDRPPVLTSPGDKTVNENQALIFTLSATDPDNDAITYSMEPALSCATLDAATGAFAWTPDYTQAGTYQVTFKATSNALLDTKTITITVNNVDRAPVLTSPGNKTVNENQLLTFTLSATDPDGDAIIYSMTPQIAGVSLNETTGEFNWTPTYEQAESYEVTFKATANSLFDAKTITITVNNVDRAPVLTSPGNQTVDENQILTFALSATDPDGDTVSYSSTDLPEGATLNWNTGLFFWMLDYTQAGTYQVTFKATANALFDTKTITITVNNIDRAPVLTSPGSKTVNENQLLVFTLSATDADGDTITYSATNLPEGATLDVATGEFSWTPTYDQAGSYEVTFKATSNALFDTKTVTITVNNVDRVPVLASPINKTVNENQLLTFTLSATDPDNDTITYSMTPVPVGAALDETTGVFTWTPDFNQAGSYTVNFTATANLLTDTRTITITVNNVDRPPVLASPGDKTVNENELLNFILSAEDPDGDAIIYSMTPAIAGVSLDENTGIFNWTPAYDQAASYEVTFKATANSLSDSKTVTITVNNVNRAPVLAAIGNQSVDERVALTFIVSAADPDAGDTLTYSTENLPTDATFDAGTRTFSWIPGYDQAGAYSVTFKVTDAGGLFDGETITITVNNVDRPPVLTAVGNKSVDENANLAFTLSATDPDNDTVTYSMEPVPNGATLDGATGEFSWTPTYEQAGVYTVTFKAASNSLSDTETITITVNNVDRAPVLASPGDQTVNENQLLTFTLSATDADNDVITYSTTNLPNGATLDENSGLFNWTPTYEQSGVYDVTFIATAKLLTDSKTIKITVNNVDRAPVLTIPGDQTVDENQLLVFTISATDPDNDAITYSMEPVLPGAALNPVTGEFSWMPTYEQAGIYTVTFKATANLLSDTKVMTITVNNVDLTPPVGSISINNGALYTNQTAVTITLDVSDPESGLTQMRLRNNTDPWQENWMPFSNITAWAISMGDGPKAVFAQVINGAGLMSEFSDTIILDSTPASGNILINNGAPYVPGTGVTITLNVTDLESGVTLMRLSNDVSPTTEDWIPFATPVPWTLSAGDGQKWVFAEVQNGAGSITTLWIDTILDTTGPVIAIASPMNDETIAYRQPFININYSDTGAGVAQTSLTIFVDGIDWTSRFSINNTQATYSVTPMDQFYDGFHTISVSITDLLGNQSSSSSTFRVVSAAAWVSPWMGTTLSVNEPSNPINGTMLTIPMGAVTEQTLFTISQPTTVPPLPFGLIPVSGFVEFGPTGVIFTNPVTMQIPYNELLVQQAGRSEDSIQLLAYDATQGQWVALTDTTYVDTWGNWVGASLNSFQGIYCLAVSPLARLEIADLPTEAKAGEWLTITLRYLDQQGNPAACNRTVRVSLDRPIPGLPAQYDIQFNNIAQTTTNIAFSELGMHNITAWDSVDPLLIDTEAIVIVTGEPSLLTKYSGDNQTVQQVSQPLPLPFTTRLTDSFGNPVQDPLSITFQVIKGDGLFIDPPSPEHLLKTFNDNKKKTGRRQPKLEAYTADGYYLPYEATGTEFRIKDNPVSAELKITSTERIHIWVTAVTNAVSLHIEPLPGSKPNTDITITGMDKFFPRLDTIYSHQDGEFQKAFAAKKKISWTQDLTKTHHVYFLPIRGTINITQDTVLTSDIVDNIVVMADNITIDGNGHSITSPYLGSGYGIYLLNRSNVTIKNLRIYNFQAGIYVDGGNNNKFLNNRIIDTVGAGGAITTEGIKLWNSMTNTINNNLMGNLSSVIQSWNSSYNTVSNSRLDLRQGGQFGINLMGGSNYNTVVNNTVTNGIYGIYLDNSSNNVVANNILNNQSISINLIGASNNTIRSNAIDNAVTNGAGIYLIRGLVPSCNNEILENAVQNCWFGIQLMDNATSNIVTYNTVILNQYGLYLTNSSNNYFSQNNIYYNTVFNVWSDQPAELSFNGQGNYWGHSEEPFFVAGAYVPDTNVIYDSNSPDVVDSHPVGAMFEILKDKISVMITPNNDGLAMTYWPFRMGPIANQTHIIQAYVTGSPVYWDVPPVFFYSKAFNSPLLAPVLTSPRMVSGTMTTLAGTAPLGYNYIVRVTSQYSNGETTVDPFTGKWSLSVWSLPNGTFNFTMQTIDLVNRVPGGMGEYISSPLVYESIIVDNSMPMITANCLPNPTNGDTTLSATATDMYTPITKAEYWIDTANPVPTDIFQLTPVDGTFDNLTENLSAVISTALLPDGYHTVYVRAMDSVGWWSAPMAAYFIKDTIAPVVTITNIAPNPTGTYPISIQATAVDQTTIITQAEYWIDSETNGKLQMSAVDGWFDNLIENITDRNYLYGLADGVHTVFIRARDAAGNWSDPVSAGFIKDTTGPVSPALNSPADNSATINKAPTFSWAAVTDDYSTPVSYILEIDDDPSFTSINISKMNLPDTTYTLSGSGAEMLGEGLYYWRVKASDSLGNIGLPSAAWSFRVDTTPPPPPDLDSPAPGNITKDNKVTFNWSSVTDYSMPVSYVLEVDDDQNFASINVITPQLFNVTYTLSDMEALGEGLYYWRVRASDSLGNTGLPSAAWGFRVDNTPPDSPTLNSPLNSSNTANKTPSFNWASVTDDYSMPVSYVLEVDDDQNFASININKINLSGQTYALSPAETLDEGVYYWRVKASDNVGNISLPSAPWSFRIDTTPPPPPDLVSPANTNITKDNKITFNWSVVTDYSMPVRYVLEISTDPNFAYFNITTGQLSDATYTLSGYMNETLSEGLYYWRVKAIDGASNTGSPSTPWSFRIDTTPPTVGITSLTPNPTNTDPTLLASASDLFSIITQAEYYIGNDPGTGLGIALTAKDGSFDSTAENITGLIPIAGLTDGVYAIYVRARDQAGNWSSPVVTNLTKDTTPPTVATISVAPNPANTNPTLSASVIDVPSTPIIRAEYYIDNDPGVGQGTALSALDGAFDETSEDITATIIIIMLSEGSHNVYVRVMDAAGNWSAPAYTTFVKDTTPPEIFNFTPPNGSFTNNQHPTISASYSDAGAGVDPAGVKLFVNNNQVPAQVTPSGVSYTPTDILADGVYNVMLECIDTIGNPVYAVWSFSVDTIPPVIQINYPTEGINMTNGMDIYFEISYNDDGSGIDLQTLTILLNNTDVTGIFTKDVTQANYHPDLNTTEGMDTYNYVRSLLHLDQNTISVTIKDRAGNNPPPPIFLSQPFFIPGSMCFFKIIDFKHNVRPLSEKNKVCTGVSENGGTLQEEKDFVEASDTTKHDDVIWTVFKFFEPIGVPEILDVTMIVKDKDGAVVMTQAVPPKKLTGTGLENADKYECDPKFKYVALLDMAVFRTKIPDLGFAEAFEAEYTIIIEVTRRCTITQVITIMRSSIFIEIFNSEKIGSLYKTWLDTIESTFDISLPEVGAVPFDAKRFDVTFPMAFSCFHKSRKLIYWCNEDFITQSYPQSPHFGDDVWMTMVVKYLERLTAVGILKEMNALPVPLTPKDISRLSSKWVLFYVGVDDLNKKIAQDFENWGERVADVEAVLFKCVVSLEFLMIHHQTDLMKVVTDAELAGPNKVCGPTSFRNVYALMQGKAEELINAPFDISSKKQGETIRALETLAEYLPYLAKIDPYIIPTLRAQLSVFLPDDMPQEEKDALLQGIPSAPLDTYLNSLNRVITKMEQDP